MGEGAMIALLPMTNDWCRIDLPHMTLVYAGKTDEIDPAAFNEMAKDAASLAMLTSPIYLRVTGTEVFGDGTDDSPSVDVLTLMPSPELWAMRRSVEHWDASQHDFKPHCTIGPAGSGVMMDKPPALAFDRILCAWGDEKLTFWMKR